MRHKRIKQISTGSAHSIPFLRHRLGERSKDRCNSLATYIPLLLSASALLLVLFNFIFIHTDSTVYAEEGISTYATTANPTTTLQISNSSLKDIVSPGSTSYVSSKVNITAQDITDYTLIISGPTNLSGTTSITGAGGKTGNSLVDNTWGYAWADPDTDDKGLTYSSLSENGSTLASGKATSLDMSKKLTFAAKFAEDAESGHYKANVTLSLAATPREVATGFNGIYDMQEMTAEICNSATIGQTGSLEDVRDGSIYTVGKLSDGKCWMTQNLKLDLTKTGTATAAESDNLSADFPTETLTSTDKFTDNNDAAQFSKNPTVNNSNPGDSKGYRTEYGYYYSWCAATGGTCGDVSADGGDASGSICPKGWKLPKGGTGTTNDFAIMGGITSSVVNDANYWSSAKSPSFSSNTLTVNGSTWIAAGFVDTNGLTNPGSHGAYWSSTAISSTLAYYLYFSSGSFRPAYNYIKYRGYPIRCVAETRTLSDITKMQEMTPTICSNTSIGTTKTLTDTRDNSTYTVGKLSDGNCWMTQNLRIVNKTITPADSDVTGTFTIPASSTSGFSSYDIANAYYSNDTSYGAYYSWYAVTAGTGTQSMSSGNAASSICPKGWRLPTGGSDGEFQTLYNKWTPATWTTYNGKNGRWLGAPSASGGAFFPAAGYYDESSPRDIGSNGSYWSSTAYSNNSAFNPYFYSSTITFIDRSPKYLGFSARCIAR